ncbi:hypothetical protein [Paenibacillus polymyxa]|uniref:hypothetical protein n=1 Tax=Paenibacillus polymyxa TaxID=1406 RepID=UPI0023F72B8B|nr:hypothetical protein [Paenibacillus polymyxa]
MLRGNAPDNVIWHLPDGGLNIWIEIPCRMHSDTFILEAKAVGLPLLNGAACYPIQNNEGYFRLRFSNYKEADLEK